MYIITGNVARLIYIGILGTPEIRCKRVNESRLSCRINDKEVMEVNDSNPLKPIIYIHDQCVVRDHPYYHVVGVVGLAITKSIRSLRHISMRRLELLCSCGSIRFVERDNKLFVVVNDVAVMLIDLEENNVSIVKFYISKID